MSQNTFANNIVFRDNFGRVCYINRKLIAIQFLLAETLTICEAILTTIQKQLLDIIMESDSQLVIQAIEVAIQAPSQIFNVIEDIRILTKTFRYIKFIYYNKFVNKFADQIPRMAYHCISQTINTSL